MRRIYRFELATAPDTGGRGMTASGVIAVNPPFTLPGAAEEGLAWLSSRLKAHDWRVDCLAGE